MKNTTKAVLLAMVIISIIAIASASAIKPTLWGKAPAMDTTAGLMSTGGSIRQGNYL